MVPAYNRHDYLKQTLQSVLAQDPGPDRMQLCVVDNASTNFDASDLLRRLAGERIEYVRHPQNIGGIRNINSCINLSRGRWVHVLHDDDFVMPGFYAAYEKVIATHLNAAIIFCPAIRIDHRGVATGFSSFNSADEGPVRDFLLHQATGNHVPTPSVVIPRDLYEKIGAYSEKLAYVPDWEMAFRAGQHGPAISLALPYVAVRWHEGSDSARLIKTPSQMFETKAVVDELVSRLPREAQAKLATRKYAQIAHLSEVLASINVQAGDRAAQIEQLKWAYRLDPSRPRLLALLRAKAARLARSIMPRKQARLSGNESR